MALKGSRKGQQNVAVESEPDMDETAEMGEMDEMDTAGNETGEDTSTDADTGTGGSAAPRRTYNRGPQLEWTEDRQRALILMLKSPKAPGTIRTAQSVADALAAHPAFEGETLLDAARVKSFIARAVKDLETAGRPVPEYLTLDRARRVIVNLSLFETEDEADNGGETEAED